MSFLIVFLIIWICGPGPIAVLTVNRTRSQGIAAGLAIAAGATATTVLILCSVLLVHQLNLSIVQFSTSRMPQIFSALLIIALGIHAGYKVLKPTAEQTDDEQTEASSQKHNVLQGMLVAISGIPQSILFYIILIPQTAAVGQLRTLTVTFGLGQIALTFLWYAAIACTVSYVQNWLQNPRVSRRFDFATAVLMVGVGINILV